VALICDTGMWSRERPAVTIMLRGLVGEEVTITAADRDLHSGMFGGPARNPIHVLADIIAALHDSDGRVTLPGFYDGVGEIPAPVKSQWDELGFNPAEFLGEVGLSIPAGEKGRTVLEQIWSRPTCEVNGISGGYTGQGFKTVLPAKAQAKFSFRLVGDQDPAAIRESFRAFVRGRVPADCKVAFTGHGGSPAVKLPFDGEHMQRARKALSDEWGIEPAMVGGGGSIPVAGDFKRVLNLDALMIGFGLDDDRIHSPNEKYDLASFHRGTRSWARVLAGLGGQGSRQ
jgi:acetylornithine deacetylase/succinyl-diaminopimelate desuccinylase-like protein